MGYMYMYVCIEAGREYTIKGRKYTYHIDKSTAVAWFLHVSLSLPIYYIHVDKRIAMYQIQVIRRFASADSSDLTQTPNPSPNLSPNPP